MSEDKIYLLADKLELSADYILFGKCKEVNDIWLEICKMPVEEKVKMFLRLSAHLFRNKELKDILDMTTDHVDEIISDVIEKYDGGKLQ